MMTVAFGAVAFLLAVYVVNGQSIDMTRQAGARGPAVVESTVQLIRSSCIFPDDRMFLRRLAYVQTRDGQDPALFNGGRDGGIWRVTRNQFISTQNNPALQATLDLILHELAIDWSMVTYDDLRKPLYSGLASTLVAKIGIGAQGSVPYLPEDQAVLWRGLFDADGEPYNFTKLVENFDRVCNGVERLDLVFIIDGSSTIHSNDFERMKQFMREFVTGLEISPQKTRIGVVKFSRGAEVVFYLPQHSDATSVLNAINNIAYAGGATNTAAAINKAVDEVFPVQGGGRIGAAKVAILITDGRSNDEILTRQAADRARSQGIIFFAIGVGDDIDVTELNGISTAPSCTHVVTLPTYADLFNIRTEIERASCRAPAVIGPGDYPYPCGVDAVVQVRRDGDGSVITVVSDSDVEVFGSVTNQFPGPARYDVRLTAGPNHPAVIKNVIDGPYYLVVIGSALGNAPCAENYTLSVRSGVYPPGVQFICVQNGQQRNCTEADFRRKCQEMTQESLYPLNNPCLTGSPDKRFYSHPTSASKFIVCGDDNSAYVAFCPPGEIYDDNVQACVNATSTQRYNDLCTPQALLASRFYFQHSDPNKFIQCNEWGEAFLMDCMPGLRWNQLSLTCVADGDHQPEMTLLDARFPSPCSIPPNPDDPSLFPHPVDRTKFIRCSSTGLPMMESCPQAQTFIAAESECAAGEVALREDEDPYVTPCSQENIRLNRFHHPHPTDPNKFIQCSAAGQEHIMSCPPGMRFLARVFVCV